MININKIIVGLLFVLVLNGCVQNTALLGPAYTLVNNGSVYHASLSYGTGKAVEKITGMTATENIKGFVGSEENKAEEEENYEEFFALVKNRIEKTSKVLNLAN